MQVLGEPEGGELEAKAALMAKNASSKLPQAALPHASLRKAREAEQLKQHLNRCAGLPILKLQWHVLDQPRQTSVDVVCRLVAVDCSAAPWGACINAMHVV